MKILVRLPNWLGDMVMSVGFMNQLPLVFPGAEVSVIAKKGIHELLPFFPPHEHQFIFDKKEYKGIRGLKKFGHEIKNTASFDLFFCLPNSFSSAIMAFTSGARKTIGYKKELRQLLLTHSYLRPEGLHRAEEYIKLLELFTGRSTNTPSVILQNQFPRQDHIVVNINSEATSRRLTPEKAVEQLRALRKNTDHKIFLIGAPKEKEFVDSVLMQLPDKSNIESVAGKTSLVQLAQLLATARLMLTTDSGPAHLANAFSTPTIVLFGAGRESHTAPFNKECVTTIRLGELSCEPCEKNICVRYGIPQCLERLDSQVIVQKAKQYLQ